MTLLDVLRQCRIASAGVCRDILDFLVKINKTMGKMMVSLLFEGSFIRKKSALNSLVTISISVVISFSDVLTLRAGIKARNQEKQTFWRLTGSEKSGVCYAKAAIGIVLTART